MSYKHMQEAKITKEIKDSLLGNYSQYRPKDFVVHKASDLWHITFTFMESTDYELHTKRKGIKEFKTMNAVEACLRKMGVDEFKVVINN